MVSNGIIKKILTTTAITTALIITTSTSSDATKNPYDAREDYRRKYGTSFMKAFKSYDELPSTEVKLTLRYGPLRGKTCKYTIYSHILYALKENCKWSKEKIAYANSFKLPHHKKAECKVGPQGNASALEMRCARDCGGITHFQNEWQGMKNIKTKYGYEVKFPKKVPSFFIATNYEQYYSPYSSIIFWTKAPGDAIGGPLYDYHRSLTGYILHLSDPEDCDIEKCEGMKSIKRTIWNNEDIWETLRKITGEKLKINTEKTSFKKLHRNWTPDEAECGKVNIFGKEYNDCMAAGLLKVMKYPIIIKLLMMTFKKI
jgi:hypothetical protein